MKITLPEALIVILVAVGIVVCACNLWRPTQTSALPVQAPVVDESVDVRAVRVHGTPDSGIEADIIRIAAERNGIAYNSEDWFILLAIRKAENGKPGREFGIMNPKANDLDSQAGWCAATIMKNRERYAAIPNKTDNHSFIEFLGSRYCPVGAENDPEGLNVNWIGNVRYWVNELRNTK